MKIKNDNSSTQFLVYDRFGRGYYFPVEDIDNIEYFGNKNTIEFVVDSELVVANPR